MNMHKKSNSALKSTTASDSKGRDINKRLEQKISNFLQLESSDDSKSHYFDENSLQYEDDEDSSLERNVVSSINIAHFEESKRGGLAYSVAQQVKQNKQQKQADI